MLRKLFSKQRKNLGLPPGTYFIEQEEDVEESALLIKYNSSFYEKQYITDIESELEINKDYVQWLNLDSTKYSKLFQQVQVKADVHPMVLEDIVNTHQRPKFEDWDSFIFVVVKMLYFNSENELELEQVSFILKENLLITIQEKSGDVFNIIRNRIINNRGKIRKHGADYLMYALLDTIVDHYFAIIDDVNNLIEDLEVDVYDDPSQENLLEIQNLKQDLGFTRRYISPFRELVANMIKSESKLLGKKILIYLQDLHDHCLQVNDSMEMLKDLTNSVIEICNSSLSNKMNEIMKVLTIISTIFIPLSFLAGLYGMNFSNMPELNHPYGYPILLGLMVLIGLSMLVFFKRKKWF